MVRYETGASTPVQTQQLHSRIGIQRRHLFRSLLYTGSILATGIHCEGQQKRPALALSSPWESCAGKTLRRIQAAGNFACRQIISKLPICPAAMDRSAAAGCRYQAGLIDTQKSRDSWPCHRNISTVPYLSPQHSMALDRITNESPNAMESSREQPFRCWLHPQKCLVVEHQKKNLLLLAVQLCSKSGANHETNPTTDIVEG